MKDKLRELAERWNNYCSDDVARELAKEECATELLAILDAEGDNNSDGLIDCNKCGMTHLYGAHTCTHCGSSLYAHPARSGVVSDEDVEAA